METPLDFVPLLSIQGNGLSVLLLFPRPAPLRIHHRWKSSLYRKECHPSFLRLSLNPKQGITCHPLLYLLVSNPKLSNLAPDPNPTRFHMGQMEKVDFRMPA